MTAERPRSIFPIDAVSKRHLTDKCPFPMTTPDQYPEKVEKIAFDASKHLVNPLEVPSHIKILESDPSAGDQCVKLVEVETATHERKVDLENLAYTAPFRVLSEEGVKAFREVIDDNVEDLSICTPRNPKIIRALGYVSKFVRDLNESQVLLDHLSSFANVDIAPHPMVTNYSQINFGEPPTDQNSSAIPADVWHLDSVDYVLVIMLTDGFDGGELLVSNMDPNQAMDRVRANNLPNEYTSLIKYPKAGYGIFMQGCRIAHAVAPLTGGSTPRITAVNSYSSRDSFRVDRPSIYNALAQNHRKEVYDAEYARNIAWRCKGKLEYLIENPQFEDAEKTDHILKLVIDELTMARSLMKGEKSYAAPLPATIAIKQGGFHKLEKDEVTVKE
jgi:hypothetical protein